jgi:hypothetical protein
MLAKRLLTHIAQAGFIQAQMARGAAIDNTQLRQPDLMNTGLKMPAQRNRISTIVNERQVLTLIPMPRGEMFLCGSNGECKEQNDADYAEGSNRVTEQRSPCRRKDFLYRLH